MRELGLIFMVAGLVACAPAPVEDSGLGDSAPATGITTHASGSDTDDGDSGSESQLDPLDVDRLDRSMDAGDCGYPGPGDGGYGTEVGRRLDDSAAFSLIDCDGDRISVADFMCERTEGKADFNRGVLINIGAGWCGPCQEETLEFPELYDEYHDQGIEFVQVLFQDWDAQAPTQSFCEDWSTGHWVGSSGTQDVGVDLPWPVVLDQVFDWTSIYLQDPQSATPVNMLIDANGNIRWKSTGQKVSLATLRTQFDLVIEDPYGAQ
jgi:thiol-disulfide isomerase/thioredoxin